MAKRKGNVFGQTVVYEKSYKGTSLGRRPITGTMNKNKEKADQENKCVKLWVEDKANDNNKKRLRRFL